jgi:hypothetical protein
MMSRTAKSTVFRQIDITRALRAAKREGFEAKSLEIDPLTGKLKIGFGGDGTASNGDTPNEWDKVL